ncbi:MAG: choice-of-anchor V domain-containing protein [Saprospiraceae bacterium]
MKKIQPIYAVLLILFLLYSFSGNPPNANTGAPGESNCTSCHTSGNASFDGGVTIQGLPEVIIPNTTYSLSVLTSVSTGSPARAGFQMVILDNANNNAGNFSNAGNSSRVMNQGGKSYFEHDGSLSFNATDTVAWTVEWTAPNTIASDSIKIYINSILGNGGGSGNDLMVSEESGYSFQTAVALPIEVTILEVTDLSCFEANDGAARVSASGGTGVFTYEWSNDSTTTAISNLSIGRYIVTATDSDGSIGTATVTINQPEEILVSIDNIVPISCNEPVGSATISATGGVAPYSYLWSTDNTTASVNLPAGTHRVTITDANQCTSIDSVTINEDIRAPMAFAGLDVLITCADTNTETVQLDAFNTTTGTGVTYLWTTSDGDIRSGETTLEPIVAATGSYILTVTNGVNGCTALDTIVVTFNTQLPIANAGNDQVIDCDNTSVILDGSNSSQGEGVTYRWTSIDGDFMNGENMLMPVVTSAGTYVLTVERIGNCIAVDTVVVTQDANMPEADAGIDAELNCTATSLTLNGTGSIGENITYLWTTTDGHFVSGEKTLKPIIDLAGTYILTVTNTVNNCTAMSGVMVTENTALPIVAAGGTAVLTCTTTSLILDGTGAIEENITYLWTTIDGNLISGESSLNPSVDAAGTYTLTATNNLTGCSNSSAVVITENRTVPSVNAGENKQIDCANATVVLEGSGSEEDKITYLWTTTNGNIISSDTILTPRVNAGGVYVLTATNTMTGCTASDAVEVIQDATLPQVTVSGDVQIGCADSDTIQIAGNATMGTNIIYEWTTEGGAIIGNTTTLQTMIAGVGRYTLMATDTLNNCSSNASFVVTKVTPPTANAGADRVLNCANENLILDGSGSIGDHLIYEWSTMTGNFIGDNKISMPTVDEEGIYTLTVTDTLTGCTATDILEITEDSASDLFAASGDAEQLTCGKTSLTLNANASEGENIIYQWTTEEGNIVADDNSLTPTIDQPGKYILTVQDTSMGCTAVSTIKISQDITLPTVSIAGEQALNCTTTAVTLVGRSDTEFNLAYTWTTTDGSMINGAMTPILEVNAGGTYTLTVVDTFTNCAASASVTITADAALPMVNTGLPQQLDCKQDTLTLAGTGSAGDDFTILWTTEDGNFLDDPSSFTPMIDAPGTYVLTVTDTTSGCSNTSSVVIIEDLAAPTAEAGAATQSFCDNST